MKKLIISLIMVPSLLMSVSGKSNTEISMEDAKNKTFTGNICSMQYSRYILMPNQTASAQWPGEEDTQAKADQLVADTTKACEESEKEVKAALDAMKTAWFAQCVKFNSCTPNTYSITLDGAPNSKGATNCANGSVKVSNMHNAAMFCTYPVENGQTKPKLADKENERCYVGEDDTAPPGYGGATVSIPSKHREAKFFIYLTCYQPGTPHLLYKIYEDEEEPKKPPIPVDPKKDK